MSAFIPVRTYHNGFVVDAIQNVDHIIRVWKADCRDDMGGECFYWITDGSCTLEHAAEPYESLVAKILAATVKEEKGKIPHTPLKEKGETSLETKTRARTREKFVKPTVEAVAKYIRDNGYTFDAEAFWNFYESKGWRVGNHVMKSWTSACVTWQKRTDAEKKRESELTAHIDARADEREAKRTAHLDAKMEEREAKRERRSGGGRKKADNVVAWLVPGSWAVDRQIREEGLDKVLEAADFEIRQPGCSACLAMNDDKVPAGKYAVSTSNRNFEGRQGPGSRTILASPLVAAAAAVTGVITDPRELL